ncbi:Endoglucanase-4 [Paramyrothecium foliicola]|nr:Endoglucanase-4 [Paramyrothecium foliicola]
MGFSQTMFHSIILKALLAATAVSAHGYVASVVAGGKTYKGYNPSIYPWQPDQGSVAWPYQATDLGFVAPDALRGSEIACHRGSSNAKLYATVAAGQELTLTWKLSHKGPIFDYLAPCNGECTTANKDSLRFFKIAEKGQIARGAGNGTPGRWAPDDLISNGLKWKVRIPANVAPGNYVLRHEILALHSAGQQGGAQFYPQCINLKITGSGNAKPTGVRAAELYTANHPGVVYNIYNDNTNPTYRMPGPAVAR